MPSGSATKPGDVITLTVAFSEAVTVTVSSTCAAVNATGTLTRYWSSRSTASPAACLSASDVVSGRIWAFPEYNVDCVELTSPVVGLVASGPSRVIVTRSVISDSARTCPI